MRRSDLIRAVFCELRHTVAPSVTSAQVLACAKSLVDLFAGGNEPLFDLRSGGSPRSMRGVDRMLTDGWALLHQESDCDEDVVDQIAMDLRFHNGFDRILEQAA